ncbi:hypothetical protein FHY25_002504 [Xanthomonas arboricola]|nr:hypothetical protein [Xanthomonas campestris]MCW2007923.1 hypothetical protein [Xanthomonas campestris]
MPPPPSPLPLPVFRLLLPPFHLCRLPLPASLPAVPPSVFLSVFRFLLLLLLLLPLLLTLSLHQRRLKASRAPQLRGAEEAPLSERSEFGRRATRGEERRAPVQLHRTGSRRRQRFWFLLPRQKELAPQARKPCTCSWLRATLINHQKQVQTSTASAINPPLRALSGQSIRLKERRRKSEASLSAHTWHARQHKAASKRTPHPPATKTIPPPTPTTGRIIPP